ncbi:hypothetical protein A2643_02950 [Candidatus Nomurabacteria bacterium RIFCSPHIGHO2_01_FULL_39_220]|uniref:Uncharacterized protein n=1 Tax=Candidatus Nomurabacteria bacterium RIFCSPLOWO2_02_FULL_40_67 TaxID=1801787 RepID=A0A1F6Y605_9BACT|nr:MAG: hypothetical protein UV43_C0038G0012 [Parcubacteria group bacterium GW2011_GWF2_42_7]OGI70173.1 MAG: hypothetical protein A2643_02950 [Candidatus Nomurabacteria bacterium RIFCSPHIGHO2_01_FULL_39_220]OGI72682.1 MAG: hypothetical protein A2W56_00325 [Candidatus Nomurabacteria bacterium RIFCSPHIGHO2_02_41_18]OGI78627.1 MAG: hypothetical protein A3C65_02540 [Candidatus Nomurabacteria bacterium RIFCSPHIGHO2_02_FULL_41_150]OGI81684.1 MAG: hypothetical protein A3E03_04105 [Candidatus Nomurabac
MKAKIIQNIKSIILALILMLGVGVVSAVGTWKNPDCGPTGCNTDTPINVSDTIQTKDGGLILGGGLVTGRLNPPYGLIVEKGNVGIGTAAPTRKLTVDIGSPNNIDRDGIQISGSTLNIGLFLENKRMSGTPLWSITSAASGSGFGAGNLVIQRQLSGEQWYGNPDLTSAVFTPSGNMGIGTNAPGAKLEVAGQVKITGGSPGLNKILASSDASGLASWKTKGELGLGSGGGVSFSEEKTKRATSATEVSENLGSTSQYGACFLTKFEVNENGSGAVDKGGCRVYQSEGQWKLGVKSSATEWVECSARCIGQ